MSQQNRPVITNGKIGVGSFGVAIMPDGTSDSLRGLIRPDGFHFEPYDFDDVVLPSVTLISPKGIKFIASFNDQGELLINGSEYTPTQLKLYSPNGTTFSVVIDDEGKLTARKVDENESD